LPEQSLLGRSPVELTAIFYCLIWDSPNLEGRVPIFISPKNRVAQLYPRALGSLFVASYDSQGYGGGILTLLHTGQNWLSSDLISLSSISSVRVTTVIHSSYLNTHTHTQNKLCRFFIAYSRLLTENPFPHSQHQLTRSCRYYFKISVALSSFSL
jgi:hypothetical protein